MKRALQLSIILVFVMSLSLRAFAVDDSAYWLYDGSSWRFDREAYEAAVEAESAVVSVQAPESASELIAPEPSPSLIPDTTESAGANYERTASHFDAGDNAGYPVGSYVDEAGNVWLGDELLSPGTTPAMEPASPAVLSVDVLGTPVPSESAQEETGTPVYSVADLRSSGDSGLTSNSGVKGLVVSIFGSYEPVTEETVITETVDGNTVESTIRTVVPGPAGVDYQWLGSVALFGILLLCLGKLLGGALK